MSEGEEKLSACKAGTFAGVLRDEIISAYIRAWGLISFLVLTGLLPSLAMVEVRFD